MKPAFNKIAIIGVGLLGGSIALRCRAARLAKSVAGYGRNQDTLAAAERQGVIDCAAADIRQAVKGAGLVIVCTPVGSIAARVREMAPFLEKGCIVTDVGSVKGGLVRRLEKMMPAAARFVGSHPIAGGEKSGFHAARADLFNEAMCIVTPTARTDAAALARVISFWEGLGCRVVTLDADEHDVIYGAVSHLPHVVAYALVNTVGAVKTRNHKNIAAFSGNGFRDATRLAASEPVMWKDICVANKKSVVRFIDRFQRQLDKIKRGIARGEEKTLLNAFAAANENRRKLARRS